MPNSGLSLTAESYKTDMTLSFLHEHLMSKEVADGIHTKLPELKAMFGVGQEGYDEGDTMASGRLRKVPSGNSLDIEIEYETNDTVQAYSRYGIISTKPQEGFTRAFVDWKQYAASTTIDGYSERINGGGAESLFPILRRKTSQTAKSFKRAIAIDLWGQNNSVVADSLVLNGIPYYVGTDPTTGTCAAVDRSLADNTFWRNRYNGTSQAVTETAPSFSARGVEDLFDMILESSPGGGDGVDVFFMSDTVMGYVFKRMSNAIIYEPGGSGEVGLGKIMIHGRPAVHTKHCPAGRIYGLSLDTWYVAVHPNANFTPKPFQQPWNQDARTALSLLQANVICENPRWNLVYSGIVA